MQFYLAIDEAIFDFDTVGMIFRDTLQRLPPYVVKHLVENIGCVVTAKGLILNDEDKYEEVLDFLEFVKSRGYNEKTKQTEMDEAIQEVIPEKKIIRKIVLE